MKKAFALLLAVLMLAALFAGCGKQDAKPESTAAKPGNTETKPETAAAQPEADGVFLVLNGQNVRLGVPYADLQDKLGEEIQPSEVMQACDPGSDWKQTRHYYDGAIVTEDKDGNVDGFTLEPKSGSEVSLMGKIRIGSSLDEVKEALGEPDSQDLNSYFFTVEGSWIGIFLDDATGLVAGANIMSEAP